MKNLGKLFRNGIVLTLAVCMLILCGCGNSDLYKNVNDGYSDVFFIDVCYTDTYLAMDRKLETMKGKKWDDNGGYTFENVEVLGVKGEVGVMFKDRNDHNPISMVNWSTKDGSEKLFDKITMACQKQYGEPIQHYIYDDTMDAAYKTPYGYLVVAYIHYDDVNKLNVYTGTEDSLIKGLID